MMENQNKQYAEYFEKAADLLEQPDVEWRQAMLAGTWNNKKCFCAHGALAYISDSRFKQEVDEINFYTKNFIQNRINHILEALEYQERGGSTIRHMIYEQWKLHEVAFDSGLSVAWNDTPCRTKSEVINKLREIAKSLKEEK